LALVACSAILDCLPIAMLSWLSRTCIGVPRPVGKIIPRMSFLAAVSPAVLRWLARSFSAVSRPLGFCMSAARSPLVRPMPAIALRARSDGLVRKWKLVRSRLPVVEAFMPSSVSSATAVAMSLKPSPASLATGKTPVPITVTSSAIVMLP
jgi:hypothetical protein